MDHVALNDHFPAMKKNVIEFFLFFFIETWFILLVKIIILIMA